MKPILHVLLFIMLSTFAHSQIGTQVDYEDNFGPIILTYVGQVNMKASYSGTDAGATVVVSWTGSKWVITIDVGTGDIPSFESTGITTNNPPNLSIGNWQDIAADGTDLIGLSGSGTASILPVELFNFNAKVDRKSIFLHWNTASENNNEKFEIEESRQGREFQKVGEVEGNETTLIEQEYSFEVENPQKGNTYYRLKQVDFDKQFEYSEVIFVNFEGKDRGIVQFYPNPSKTGLVSLSYSTNQEDEITVSVFDMTGKLVFNQISPTLNDNSNLSFDFSSLNSGIYMVKVEDERNPTYHKLIIER